MFKDIFFPLIVMIVAGLYLKNLYKRRGGFLKEDFYDNTIAFKGWTMGIIIIIASVCYLIKGIIIYL